MERRNKLSDIHQLFGKMTKWPAKELNQQERCKLKAFKVKSKIILILCSQFVMRWDERRMIKAKCFERKSVGLFLQLRANCRAWKLPTGTKVIDHPMTINLKRLS